MNCKLLIIILIGFSSLFVSSYSQSKIGDKTLVVWVSPGNLEQGGGSALTIDDGHSNFDGIVFGEIEKGRWMAGSNSFSRTEKDQLAYPEENVKAGTFIQIAIVYKGNSISILRDGKPYASYVTEGQQEFNPLESTILFGLRHLDAGDQKNTFTGKIKDARIYDMALTADVLGNLVPGEIKNEPHPWAWWDFSGEGIQDATRKFTDFKLVGEAFIEDGCLVLEGDGASLIASRTDSAGKWDPGSPVPKSLIRDTRIFREKLLTDPYRPAYHFCVPEGNGMPGDPNGAFYHDGLYHLMYLYNREESGFCWGHISSSDLLHWRHYPDAIGPGNGDEGCFSGGGFVDDDGKAYLSYWMLWGDKGIGMARNIDDDFLYWEKFDTNPVIKSTEWGITEMKDSQGRDIAIGSADPSNIWKKNGKYYMLTGNLLVLNKFGRQPDSPENEKGDRLYLFESEDLTEWTYLHRFYESDRKWTEASEDNMCPSFLPLPSSPDGGPASNKHLLLFISHNLGCQYYIGDYRDDRFYPEEHARMTWNNAYFAPEALVDDKGRQIMWAWVFDERPGSLQNEYGWTGTYGLPRSLWLNEDGGLGMEPVKELRNLRKDERSLSGIPLNEEQEIILDSLGTELMELEITVEPGNIDKLSLELCASEDGREKTLVNYNRDKKCLEIDTQNSSLKYGKKVVECAPFELKKGEALNLRIFIDRSIIEVYANNRQAIARRIYPTLGGSGIRISANGDGAKIISFKRWEMNPSNPY